MKRILFLMGSWDAPSERFLARQLQMLYESELLECAVAARLCGERMWNGVPVLGLAPTHAEPIDPAEQLRALAGILDNTYADTILCQYGTVAALLEPVLKDAPQQLFIHFHGKDSQGEMHDPTYRAAIERLGKRARIIGNPVVAERLSDWDIGPVAVKNYGVTVPKQNGRGVGTDTVNILHVGRLVDCKSPDRTIEAFNVACALGLKGRLTVIGDGPLRTMCELIRARSPWRERIELQGTVSDRQVDLSYRNADIFTLHSVRGELTGQVESFGIAVVEAMAAGLPVVACPIGGVRHTVVDGETGLLFPSGDIQRQAAAFLALARDPDLRHRLGTRGWRRASEVYSYEAERERLVSILSC